MYRAVFIDRDGTINNDTGHYYIFKPDDFVLNEGVGEGLKVLQDAGFLIIVITNQGGVSKGKYSLKEVDAVHEKMKEELNAFGVVLTDIYVCPHHSDNEKCICRKPGNINIEKAISRFKIDRNHSFMIGDSDRDVQAGKRSGLKTVKIEKNSNLLPVCKSIVAQLL